MRRWWRSLGRSEQIALASVLVTLVVGLLGAAPAYR
jgi:ABC-type spermidine/putrescine transport system permease subunit II